MTLSGATTLGQNGPESNENEGVLHIPGASPSDCLASYPGHSEESHLSVEKQLVYSTAPANRTISIMG